MNHHANSYGYQFPVSNWRGCLEQYTRNQGTFCVNMSGKQLSVTNVSNSTRIGTIYHTEHYVIVGSCYQPGSNPKEYTIIAFRNSAGAWDLGMLNDETVYLNNNYKGWNTSYGTVYTRGKSMTFGGVTFPAGTKVTGAGYSVALTPSVGWRGAYNMAFTGIGGRSISGSFDSGVENNSMTPSYFSI